MADAAVLSIKRVAELLSRMRGVVGVALGGSRALDLEDRFSDVELYAYHVNGSDGIEADAIHEVAGSLDASLTRSDELVWNMAPWGPHSFLDVSGTTFEIGYRDVEQTSQRLSRYLDACEFRPSRDIHDLAFGHYPSGLAACIASGRVLYEDGSVVTDLQSRARQFPPGLRRALVEHHGRDAHLLIARKLPKAAERYDVLHFNACAARILRSLVIVTLALAGQHFPGDKWQMSALRRANLTLTPPVNLEALRRLFALPESDTAALLSRMRALEDLRDDLLGHPQFPADVSRTVREAVNW